MFDGLFDEIRDNIIMTEHIRSSFKDFDETTQRELMLKQRATEAINDQQYTQQLFFLLERKKRIKHAFEHIDALKHFSLSDIDLSSVDKINHFIAIIDLLSSSTLSDPSPYIQQIKFKPIQNHSDEQNSSGYKSIRIGQVVVKRNRALPPETPTQLIKQSKSSRSTAGKTIVEIIDGTIQSDNTPSLHFDTPNNQNEDIVLEGITLDNEEDTHNFVKLLALLEKGEDVSLAELKTFSTPVITPRSMLKVSELCDRFYNERKKEWKDHKTCTTNQSIYKTFIEIVGDVFVDELNYQTANHYIDTLQKLPTNRNKLAAYKDKSIEELLALEGTFEPMKTPNVNKNIERLKSVFLWAVQRQYMSTNILEKMRIKDRAQKVQVKNQRFRFDESDLDAIFNSDKYTKNKHDRTYDYWIPLLGLYTGARLGELSQLRLDDIHTEDKVWVININEKEDKTVKTANGIRSVPIHKALVTLGFIKYVQHLKEMYKTNKLHTNLIFPDVVRGRDGYGHNISKSFDRYLTSVKIKVDGKSFHSLRHTFADEQKQAEENTSVTAEILGHSIDNETLGRYGKDYKITIKKAAIDRYTPLTEAQIKKILPFKLWKEFSINNMLDRTANKIIDSKKSIKSNKHLHRALANALNIEPPVIVPRKPKKTA